MRLLFIILTSMIFYSCTQYASLSSEGFGLLIHPVKMEITHLNEIDWKVGKRKEATVTQSFTFIIDLPKVKTEDLDYLIKRRGVDSWILRLIVNRGSQTQDLGSLYAPFRPKSYARGIQGSVSSVTMKVYYAAAYASERFRNFKCPAFNHNKKINSMEIEGENEEFSLMLTTSSPYGERSHLVELTPSSFNGGNSLKGNYYVEIAPYDSKNKVIHSAFKRIPMFINIENEEVVALKGCEGVDSEME